MNEQIIDLSKRFKLFRDMAKEQAAALKETNATLDSYESELLAAMVDEGVNSIDIDGIGKISMSTRNFLSVTQEHLEDFYHYLRESGNGGLFKETVHPKTLTAFLDQHLDELTVINLSKGAPDGVTARNQALDFLNSKGASSFTKRGLSLRK